MGECVKSSFSKGNHPKQFKDTVPLWWGCINADPKNANKQTNKNEIETYQIRVMFSLGLTLSTKYHFCTWWTPAESGWKSRGCVVKRLLFRVSSQSQTGQRTQEKWDLNPFQSLSWIMSLLCSTSPNGFQPLRTSHKPSMVWFLVTLSVTALHALWPLWYH